MKTLPEILTELEQGKISADHAESLIQQSCASQPSMSAEQVEGSKCSYNNEQLIEKVQSIVRDLAMSGGKSWSLQVPVNFDKDPDVLISELCKRFKHLLSKQEPSKVSTPLICRQDL